MNATRLFGSVRQSVSHPLASCKYVFHSFVAFWVKQVVSLLEEEEICLHFFPLFESAAATQRL